MTGYRIQAQLPTGWADIARRDTQVQANTLANSMTVRTGINHRVVPEARPVLHSGQVTTGNTDVEASSTWSPPAAPPERPALPGQEHLQHSAWPLLTEGRAFALALAIAGIGLLLGAGTFADRMALAVAAHAHQEVHP